MHEFSRVACFFIGLGLGVVLSAVIAGFVWISKTVGFEEPISDDEVKKRIGSTWGGQ